MDWCLVSGFRAYLYGNEKIALYSCWHVVPVKQIEYVFVYIIVGSPCTPYSIYLRGTVHLRGSSKGCLTVGKPYGPKWVTGLGSKYWNVNEFGISKSRLWWTRIGWDEAPADNSKGASLPRPLLLACSQCLGLPGPEALTQFLSGRWVHQ